MVKHCGWCGHDRETRTQHDDLMNGLGQRVGMYVHFICNACGTYVDAVFHRSYWLISEYKGPNSLETINHGRYNTKDEAMKALKDVPGIYVHIDEELEGFNYGG